METEIRKRIEYALFKSLGVRGCKNVAIDKIDGLLERRYMIPTESIVDYMTIDRKGIISCYIIITNEDDLIYFRNYPLYGHRNFFVMTEELFNKEKEKRDFHEMVGKETGVLTLNDKDELLRGFACSYVKIPTWKEILLLECFARATARETAKLYELEYNNQITPREG